MLVKGIGSRKPIGAGRGQNAFRVGQKDSILALCPGLPDQVVEPRVTSKTQGIQIPCGSKMVSGVANFTERQQALSQAEAQLGISIVNLRGCAELRLCFPPTSRLLGRDARFEASLPLHPLRVG